MARILVLAFIWGWSFLFIKVAVEGMPPPAVAFARVALGLAVMAPVLHWRGERLGDHRHAWRHFAVMGLLYNAAPFTLLAFSEERITSALTAVLNASTPLFTAISAGVFLSERLRRLQIGGLALGFVGVAIATGLGVADIASSSVAGSAAAVAASACYGIAFAYARVNLAGVVDPYIAATGQLTAGVVLTAPFAFVTAAVSGVRAEPHRIAAVVLLGVVGTGFAYVLMYRAIAELGPTRASTVTYIIPVVAVAVGIAFLDESLQFRTVIGGFLTLVGIGAMEGRVPRLLSRIAQ